jgi:putative DNA primase/helicase
MINLINSFKQTMQNAGIEPHGEIIADGVLHRFTVTGDRARSDNGWYVFHADDSAAGAFGCWKRGIAETWSSKTYQVMTPAEKTAYTAKMGAMKRQREEERERIQAECRVWCANAWSKAKDATNENLYLKRKDVNAYGLKAFGENLLVPLQDMAGIIHGIQFIKPDGTKRFKTGTNKAGHFFKIGKSKDKTVIICEGYATGASIHQATGHSVVIAFDSGNLLPVAQNIRSKYPDMKIVIAADDDHATEGNPGLTKATAAARAVGGFLAIPVFPDNRGPRDSDLNDLLRLAGPEAVRFCIEGATVSAPDSTEVPPGHDVTPPFDLSRLTLGSAIVGGDYTVSYLVDKLIPEQSVILFYAKGGSGKSTVATQIGASVLSGTRFLGLATLKRPVVVIDYENPLAVLSKRITAVDGAGTVHFWTGSNSPPQLNKADWQDLKSLITTLKNPLLIIDTLSSSCSELDILSNGHFSPVMQRMVELRNCGATIMLLHHTPKQDETKYIGASCIYNQCDHILAMYPVKTPGSQEEMTDEDDAKVYRLGTVDKTRFEHFAMYIEFDEEKSSFVLAADPDKKILDRLSKIIQENAPVNQTTITKEFGTTVSKNKLMRLLKHNEGRLWNVEKGDHNANNYQPIQFSSFSHLYSKKTEKHESGYSATCEKQDDADTQQKPFNSEFSSFSGGNGNPENIPVYDESDFIGMAAL